MRRWTKALAIGFFLLSACITTRFKGIKPIYPVFDSRGTPPVVDSLKPTFRWETSPESGVDYDLVVYEVIIGELGSGPSRKPGKVAYYRQGLAETTHTIEEPLKPNTEYFWSIRFRQGGEVSAWSTYNQVNVVPLPFVVVTTTTRNVLLLFKTPAD